MNEENGNKGITLSHVLCIDILNTGKRFEG